jgi:hypothetical protein
MEKMVHEPSGPDKVPDRIDKGDDVQRRFRYQAAYAALLSTDLLSQNSEFEEIFCEQHEDILVRRKDKTFEGIQVKTREPRLGPFRFGEPEIMRSLERFIECEKHFPGKFSRYAIVSNCGFWEGKSDSSNMVFCLDLVRKHGGSTSCFSEVDFSKRIKELSEATQSDSSFVLQVLLKVRTQQYADLDRFEVVLADAIARIPENSDQRYDVLRKAADELIGMALKAASLSHESPKMSYIALFENPEKETIDLTIQEKRLTSEKVKRIVDQVLNPAILLQSQEPIDILNLPKGMKKMELKMAMGGLSAGNTDNAKDLMYSAITLLSRWTHMYGTTETRRRYEHLRVFARNVCQEEYDSVRIPGIPFGDKLLKEVRRRLQDRYSEIKHVYIDFSYEHLVGIVWMLTEECKVWWSEEFEIPEVVAQ